MRCRIDSSLLGLCKAKRARPPEEDLEEKRMDVGNDKSSPLQPHRCCQTARYILNFLRHSVRNAARIFNAFLRAPQPDVQSLAFCKVYPYLTVLTFPSTVSRRPESLAILKRFFPWEDLAIFFASIPKNIHVPVPTGTEHWVMLTSGCAPPLPEY